MSKPISRVPSIIRKDEKQEVTYDLYSHLLQSRQIFVGGEVADEMANSIVAQLLYLNSVDETKDILVYVNSPGGAVTAGLAIIDAMRFTKADVWTICFGQAASMGAHILGSGTKGKRVAISDCRIMIHQPLGGTGGQVTDIAIQAQELLRIKSLLNLRMAENCGRTIAEIEKHSERDTWMTGVQAQTFGLVDHVFTTQQQISNLINKK